MDARSNTLSNHPVSPAREASRQWRVRTYLIWLVLACLLPGVIGAVALIYYEYRQTRAQLEDNMLQTARALVQNVDNHMLRAQDIARSLSTSDALAREDFAYFHQRARKVIDVASTGDNIILWDRKGQQVVNTIVEYGTPLPKSDGRDMSAAVFSSGHPLITDIFTGRVSGRPIMTVNVPVVLRGEIAYVLSVGVMPDEFNVILKAQNLPPDWIAVIFDSRGTIAGRSHQADQFVGQKGADALVQGMANRQEGSLEARTLEGTRVVAFFSQSPVTHWKVMIAVPGQAIAGSLVRTLSLLAVGVAALFLVGLAMARHMSGRIAHAFQALIAPATALGDGRFASSPDVSVREAAEVGAAIGRASGLLKERADIIAAREQELAEAHRLARFGTWHYDLRTRELSTSASVGAIFGREIPRLPQGRESLFSEEALAELASAVQQAALTGKGLDMEVKARHASGAPLWIETKAEAVRDADGNILALRGSMQDITDRKNAEMQLRESEERFRLLADNITQLAWMADASGNIYWYNKRWYDYTGTTPEEMLGWGWKKVHHPDHIERVIEKFRRCFTTGERWEDTFPLRAADGGYRWFLSRAIPERDASGSILRWFGTNTDITAQREIEEELRMFKFFSDSAGDVHLLFDESGRIRYANRLACERLGYTEEELLDLNVADIDAPDADESFHALFDRARRGRVPPFERMHRRQDGTIFPVEITLTVLQFKGEWVMFTTVRDISERKLAEMKVREAALHDPLTGLPNRALVFEYCGHVLAAAQRNHTRGALLFIDLDRFKPINDLYGHEMGDRLLQEVARRLCRATRHEDLVGRLGGDEFVVVLPYLDIEHNRAVVVAQHVVESISRAFHIEGLELSVSPSIGISYFPEHAADTNALIHAADLAMYQAKQAGRATYRVYTPELEKQADEALALELRLKKAVSQGKLALHYQPVIDIRTGQLTGAEALVRLADGYGDDTGPGRFIPVAEASGLIASLGEWVAAEACRQHRDWLEHGLKVSIAINVSPLQFRQRELADRLGNIIAGAGIDPACLEIEVTESAIMENLSEAVQILNRIKSLGVKVALDDFGTGYSNLSRLSKLPLDKLKVDQSFVRGIEGDRASRAVTEAIIALGRSLKLDVVGEGIESADALRYLRDHGCNQAQGYWVSHPLPAAEFAQWYREHLRRDPAADQPV